MSATVAGYVNAWERSAGARGGEVRCGVYLRVSLDATGEHLAVDRQREACLRDAAARGWRVVEEYVDNSISASDERAQRPGYEAMVADLRAGRIDAVVAYDLDRLTRQMGQLEELLRIAESGRGLIATTNGEYDLTTDAGRLMARIRLAVAVQEVERKGARQRDAIRQRAKAGRWAKGGVRPFGYSGEGVVIEDEAAIVRALFDAVERGVPLRVLARVLNGEDAPHVDAPGVVACAPHMVTVTTERNARRAAAGRAAAPVPEGARWTGSTITGIVRNPKYAGLSTYTPTTKDRKSAPGARGAGRVASIVRDSDGAPVLGDWVAIVDVDQYFRVQDVLNDDGRRTNRSGKTALKHLGSGLYRCGECGGQMLHHTVGAGAAAYRCRGCGLTRSGAEAIDGFVLQVAREVLGREDVAARIAAGVQAARGGGGGSAQYAAAVEALEARRARAVDDYARGLIDGEVLAATQDAIRAELAALARPERGSSEDLALLDARDPVGAFDAAGVVVKRRVIAALFSVTLARRGRGARGFDPSTVAIAARG